MAPNPEAIAWYLQRSEALLEDLHNRVHALRARAGQLAAFSGAILALAGANSAPALGSLSGAARSGVGVALMIGLGSLIASLVIALRGSLAPGFDHDASAVEVANFASERFAIEADLWRVHVRTIRSVLAAIEATTSSGKRVGKAIKRAEIIFLVGLFSVGISFATVIAEVV